MADKHKCDSTCRHSCWSITINNPKLEEVQCDVPGWKLKGQYEVGAEGTRHFQGILRTPQVRFSAVKKVFPRAHIEAARNPEALAKYVHKEDTRVDVYTPGEVPTIFQYQANVAAAWANEEWLEISKNVLEGRLDDLALSYVDTLVRRDIEAGRRGCEWIAINPMWRSSWKKFWRSIIKRHAGQVQVSAEAQGDEEGSQEGEQEDTQSRGGQTDHQSDDGDYA